jgi:transcriptional regulator with XRE-family HTH domain
MYLQRVGFAAWLQAEIDKRDWKAATLARQAGLSKGTVSDILNQRRAPGHEFCVRVAGALHYPPEDVLRLADLLPPQGELGDLSLRQLVEVARQLSDDERAELLEIALLKLRRQEQAGASLSPTAGET